MALEGAGNLQRVVWAVFTGASGFGVIASIVFAITTPPKSKKRQRLEAMPPVASRLNHWHTHSTRSNGRSFHYYAVTVLADDVIYVAKGLLQVGLDALVLESGQQQLVNLIEGKFDRSLSRRLKKFHVSDIQSIETWGQQLVVNAQGDIHEFGVGPHHKEIATHLASHVMPNVAPVAKVEENPKSKGKVSEFFNPDIERLIFSRSDVSGPV